MHGYYKKIEHLIPLLSKAVIKEVYKVKKAK
jgi:hypothetical protein